MRRRCILYSWLHIFLSPGWIYSTSRVRLWGRYGKCNRLHRIFVDQVVIRRVTSPVVSVGVTPGILNTPCIVYASFFLQFLCMTSKTHKWPSSEILNLHTAQVGQLRDRCKPRFPSSWNSHLPGKCQSKTGFYIGGCNKRLLDIGKSLTDTHIVIDAHIDERNFFP